MVNTKKPARRRADHDEDGLLLRGLDSVLARELAHVSGRERRRGHNLRGWVSFTQCIKCESNGFVSCLLVCFLGSAVLAGAAFKGLECLILAHAQQSSATGLR